MTSLNYLKKEVEILNKALGTKDDWKQRSEEIQKLNFFVEKVIELSRNPDEKELLVLNKEIEAFNEAHPPNPDDLIKITPYLSTIDLLENLNSKRQHKTNEA